MSLAEWLPTKRVENMQYINKFPDTLKLKHLDFPPSLIFFFFFLKL